jgi:L-alanine-DL-glutamate epimerase-like enolase superfamily enzyme
VAAIASVDVIATGPDMPAVRYTAALPPVFTTVTFVVITDESGDTGIAAIESDSFGGFDLGPLEALRPMAPELVGLEAGAPSAIARLAASRLPTTSRPVPCAALEIATWDLLGHKAGLPLHQLLGGARDEVAAYASLAFEPDLAVLLVMVGAATAAGYRAAKLHVSGDPDIDIAQVREVRRSFPGLELMVDAEGIYDRRGAHAVGRALDDLDIRWLEAPVPDRDLDGYRRLTQLLHTPVIPAGGVITELSELGTALRSEPWSALRSQAMEGGVGHVRDVAALGRAFGLDLELISYGTTLTAATDLQLILGLGVGSYFEQPFPIEPWEFGTATPVLVVDGMVRAPAGSGLGMELDMDAIDAATLARFSTRDASQNVSR